MGYCASLYRCGMELSRIEDGVVTETSLPARRGVYVESRGSALWRTGRISGLEPETKLFALFSSKRRIWKEKSESTLRAGCTERTTSLAKYAILATVGSCQRSSLTTPVGSCVPASEGLAMEPML